MKRIHPSPAFNIIASGDLAAAPSGYASKEASAHSGMVVLAAERAGPGVREPEESVNPSKREPLKTHPGFPGVP
jgi:hypothetical protein